MRVLTNDPSMTAWGWAVVDELGNVVGCGCVKTAPEQKKRRIRKSDDTGRRATEIIQQLRQVIREYSINIILSESPHGSQNASAAVMIGMVSGIIHTLSECLGIPLETYSEQDAKKALLHKKSATKDETIEEIKKHYVVKWKGVKYMDEAIADALAVHYVATQQSQLLRMMR